MRAAVIAGSAVVALGLGTAAAFAATGDAMDDPPGVVQTVTTTPADDHGTDAPATHDIGDDHGTDAPATHDVGDDHGSGGHGSDD
ncbi:hypothetical protein [Leifsonia sp. RAF41]|uniref:hypothetical protein n=1 Tax=Leifsonia sp. RAF41 TaxID=3233056 RepID=UPI003F95A198